MQIDDTVSIVKTPALYAQQSLEVNRLVQACKEYEELELPLHREPARTIPSGETNQFLAYQRGELIGIVSLPPDDNIEVLGMVHPDYRRKGVGRALIEAVKIECRFRAATNFLLVCEAAAHSGAVFATALGGQYRFSEYQMELNRTMFHRYIPQNGETIVLRRADAEDLDTFVSIQAAAWDTTPQECREELLYWLEQPHQRFYIGELHGEPVGMLRVPMFDADRAVYINAFAVTPAHRGRGYGRQILSGTIEDLVVEDWEHIMIEVNVENRNALSLYRSCGFDEASEYEYYEIGV